MLNKASLICVAFVAVSVHLVSGLELVELNDANKNELQLSLYKSLEGVQQAYLTEFKFATIDDIRNFLHQCKYVNHVVDKSDDADYKGLAGKIKAIMADPSISDACSVTDKQLTEEFDEIDTRMDPSRNEYLLKSVLKKLIRLNELANGDASLKRVVQNAIDAKAEQLTDALLNSAKDDIETFFGEEKEPSAWFKLSYEYKSLCEISSIEPICKVVRCIPQTVQTIAKDFDEFAELIKSNDETKINRCTEASGVSMDEVKANCNDMLTRKEYPFKALELIRGYVSANLLSEQQVADYMREDMVLASYSALYDLCKSVN